MLNSTKLTKGLLLLVGVLFVAVVWTCLVGSRAAAQEAGAERFTMAVVGYWRDNAEPVFVIDTRKQTIAVYEFESEEDVLNLTAVRTYEYDRKLVEFPERTKTRVGHRGPSVRDMMKKAGVE